MIDMFGTGEETVPESTGERFLTTCICRRDEALRTREWGQIAEVVKSVEEMRTVDVYLLLDVQDVLMYEKEIRL